MTNAFKGWRGWLLAVAAFVLIDLPLQAWSRVKRLVR